MADTLNQDLLEAFFEDAHDVLQEWEKVTLSLTPADSVKAYEPILRCASAGASVVTCEQVSVIP